MLKPFATKIHEEVLAKLDDLAQKSRIPKSRLVEQALELLIEHHRQIDHDLLLGREVREAKRLEPV